MTLGPAGCALQQPQWSPASADNMQWDPDYHGSVMFVPVVYVTWWMFVMILSLTGELDC